MSSHNNTVWSIFTLFFVIAVTLVLSAPTPNDSTKSKSDGALNRHPKTIGNMTMGMFKDMLENGVTFRPVPPPFDSLRDLFKVNKMHLTWVPLGSLIFNNNGKIVGG